MRPKIRVLFNKLFNAQNRLSAAKNRFPGVQKSTPPSPWWLTLKGQNSTPKSAKSTPRGPKLSFIAKKWTRRGSKLSSNGQNLTPTCPKSTRRAQNLKWLTQRDTSSLPEFHVASVIPSSRNINVIVLKFWTCKPKSWTFLSKFKDFGPNIDHFVIQLKHFGQNL